MSGGRRAAQAALAAAGLRPRKRWGQHFLCDAAVARRIVERARVGPESVVLEIGPGLGALTDELAARAGRLYLIEVDRGLAARLAARYAACPHVTVRAGDVLAAPLAAIVPDSGVTVVANLPYNIATPVLFRLLEARDRFPHAVVMLQREVAARLTTAPGRRGWGVAAALIQSFADVTLAFAVPRRAFLPPPRVESAVVEIRWRAEPRVPIEDEAAYRAVVRAAFGQRRKMLRNALAALAAARGLDGRGLEAALARAGVAPTARAETLALDDFARLTRALHA